MLIIYIVINGFLFIKMSKYFSTRILSYIEYIDQNLNRSIICFI